MIESQLMRDLNDPWNVMCDPTGLKYTCMPDYRCNFVSDTVLNGVPAHVVSRLLGHSNV